MKTLDIAGAIGLLMIGLAWSMAIVLIIRLVYREILSRRKCEFSRRMAIIVMKEANVSFSAAYQESRIALEEFLNDEKINFGALGWDWSDDGAEAVAQEYILRHGD